MNQNQTNHGTQFLCIFQNGCVKEAYVNRLFCDGLNQPLKSKVIHKGPRSSLSNFLDYVLWTVGSAFTVGVAEERDTTLTSMIAAALEHTHKMAATAEPVHKMATTTTPRHVIAASHESIQVTVDVKVPSQVTVVNEPNQVTVDVKKPSQVLASGSALASCSAGSVSVPGHSTSTWTWPSIPPPVPPPLHRPPGLYRSVWKPLLGGRGAMSQIWSMNFR